MRKDLLTLLLEGMQREIAELRVRVEVLEMALDEAVNGDAADPDQPATYMDGTPINH